MSVNAFSYKKDYGWRSITAVERAEAIRFLDNFVPQNQVEIRDKVILEYFCIDNLSAQAIVRKKDKRIIAFGNRSRGHLLSTVSVLRIIYKYFPSFKKEKRDTSKNLRVELIRKREKECSPHIKLCAFCGGNDNLEEHHMIPLFMGGDNNNDNLIYLCHECHKRVSSYQRRFLK